MLRAHYKKWQSTQTLVLLKDGIKVGLYDLEKSFSIPGNSKISPAALFQTQAGKSNKRKVQQPEVHRPLPVIPEETPQLVPPLAAPTQEQYNPSGDGKRRESKRCSGAPFGCPCVASECSKHNGTWKDCLWLKQQNNKSKRPVDDAAAKVGIASYKREQSRLRMRLSRQRQREKILAQQENHYF